jgi:hypothetical protein
LGRVAPLCCCGQLACVPGQLLVEQARAVLADIQVVFDAEIGDPPFGFDHPAPHALDFTFEPQGGVGGVGNLLARTPAQMRGRYGVGDLGGKRGVLGAERDRDQPRIAFARHHQPVVDGADQPLVAARAGAQQAEQTRRGIIFGRIAQIGRFDGIENRIA